MVNNVAILEFSTSDPKKNFIVKISDVKSDTDDLGMKAVMDYIITNKIFVSPQGALKGKVSCTLEKVETTEMEW